jgi:hypothetical protein
MTILLLSVISLSLSGQKPGSKSITIPELEAHISFLASDELKGRDTGDDGLLIAARYIASQARFLGLDPLDDDRDYYQYYSLMERSYDDAKSGITISGPMDESRVYREEFIVLPRNLHSDLIIEGRVVFAGYGIKDDDHGYNDFEDIDIEDKIVLIMTRAPLDEDGLNFQFDSEKWGSSHNLQYKLQYLSENHAKAVLLVFDPKSGVQSMSEVNPRIAAYLSSDLDLKKDEVQKKDNDRLKTIMIHRNVADGLLEGSGKNLEELQKEIDRDLQPGSFELENKTARIEINRKENEIIVPNIFGYIEGRDPELKKELVLFIAHYDHVGYDDDGNIYNGADDNASGTVALLEIAEAFQSESKRPARSIGFLWVSAEELGLFGSEYYADHSLWDIEKTAAVINLDMVGRTRTEQDIPDSSQNQYTIVGGDTIKVIGGLQSKMLMEINKKTLQESGMIGEYKYNNRFHPERYFYRSDHFNFVKKDIPVLFYSTGTHHDYHKPTDIPENIDFDKFLKMTRFCYLAGFNIANHKGPITVDNPYSSW